MPTYDPANVQAGQVIQATMQQLLDASYQMSSSTPMWQDNPVFGYQVVTHEPGAIIYDTWHVGVVFRAFTKQSWPLPYHTRSGPRRLSEDGRRKWMRAVVLHQVGVGAGSLTVRVWVDGKSYALGTVEMDETPMAPRRIPLPRGTCGYTIDVEIVGTKAIRHAEVEWEDMEWEE